MKDDIVLRAKELSVRWGREWVVQNVSFTLRRGEMTAIVGPNGAGKTTLLRALLRLIPFEGIVEWHPGIAVSYIPQRFSVPASEPVTVAEFFLLKSKSFWRMTPAFRDMVGRELNAAGLDRQILEKRLGTLSSGQLQRLLLAWAILYRPGVLLFDEPTASTDVGFTETVYSIMHRLTKERGTAILLISHDLNVVFRFAERVLCINRKLFCEGPPSEALTPQELRNLFGDVAFFRHHHGE